MTLPKKLRAIAPEQSSWGVNTHAVVHLVSSSLEQQLQAAVVELGQPVGG